MGSETLTTYFRFPNFVIEDEFGGLLWVQGGISNVVPNGYRIDEIFAHSLAPKNQTAYKAAQLSVWGSGTPTKFWEDINTFRVEILPLFLGERFTVSMFTESDPYKGVH